MTNRMKQYFDMLIGIIITTIVIFIVPIDKKEMFYVLGFLVFLQIFFYEAFNRPEKKNAPFKKK